MWILLRGKIFRWLLWCVPWILGNRWLTSEVKWLLARRQEERSESGCHSPNEILSLSKYFSRIFLQNIAALLTSIFHQQNPALQMEKQTFRDKYRNIRDWSICLEHFWTPHSILHQQHVYCDWILQNNEKMRLNRWWITTGDWQMVLTHSFQITPDCCLPVAIRVTNSSLDSIHCWDWSSDIYLAPRAFSHLNCTQHSYTIYICNQMQKAKTKMVLMGPRDVPRDVGAQHCEESLNSGCCWWVRS